MSTGQPHGWYVRLIVEPPDSVAGVALYVGCCDCGWEGPKEPREVLAAEDALHHVQRARTA